MRPMEGRAEMSESRVSDVEVDLRTRLGSLSLPSPVLSAAGCAGWGPEIQPFADVAQIGAFTTPSVQLRADEGRPGPRMTGTPSGLLASVGLPGPGAVAVIDHDLAWLAQHGARVIVSIAGETTDEFVALTRAFYGNPAVSMLEVNLSSPDPVAASRIVAGVRRAAHPGTPVFAKLGPDGGDIVAAAKACVDAGADGLSMINAPLGLVLDLEAMRPALGGATGGLSGPAIRPIAVRCVWHVHRALPSVPIIGCGGVASGRDALEFLLAGASAVAVGSAIFADPTAPVRVRDELSAELGRRGFASVADAVGYAHRTVGEAADRTTGAVR